MSIFSPFSIHNTLQAGSGMFYNRTLRFGLMAALVLGLSLSVANLQADTNIQQIYSWKENVRVYPSGLQFKAKLDSGAKTSSLHAIEIEEFERDGEEWVRFVTENHNEERETIERRLERNVKIKEHGGGVQRRPVVKMGICLGRLYKEVEVNLVDRSNFITGMLVGRTFMEDDVLIDPSTTYGHIPDCDRKSIDD
ncbi:ATP-dependent zinc protease family protein [Methylohalomonas lacus]|uniref:ATP-dependent zinc protease family protein n=1 Tax=Methylohalomonas lacus TaxID=398773 RepID=UPI00216A44BC|nr:ATP-dependent zinc protease [Methylohalomonas lacus]